MANLIDIRTEVTITLFPQVLDNLLFNPSGPVSTRTKAVAERVLAAAIPRVGMKYSGTTGRPREARPSRLKDSGKVVHQQDSDWSVVFEHPIAFLHHEGTAGHTYNSGFFYNPNADTWTNSPFDDGHFALKGPFSHPGTKPNRFLTDAARSIGLTVRSPSARGRSTISTTVRKQFF